MKKNNLLLMLLIVAAAFFAASCTNVDAPDGPTDGKDTTKVETGAGSEASPYTVTQGIANQGALKWVKGYIVGYATSGTTTIYTFTADTCTQTTNILIADSKTETDPAKCLAVQLPSGVIRTGLNLKDVKANLGKEVTLYGSLEAYFVNPGLKSVTYYALEGGTTGGTKPIDTTNAIFSETFTTSLGSFTTQSVIGDQVWANDATYKCAKMTGYVSPARNANEDWLISPAISLVGKTAATLAFEHAGKFFGVLTDETTLWVSENYVDGAPTTATWSPLTIPTNVTNTDYTFVNSGAISLDAYAGKSIKIAFKYVSSATIAGTWEIKNVVVK